MARIRDLKTGQVFEGPDGAPIPEGFEAVTPAGARGEAAPSSPGYLERTASRAADRVKEIAGFPVRVGRLVAGMDKPKDFEDVALLALGNAPLIATGGTLASAAHLPKLAPLARIATALGLAKGRGEDWTTAAIEGAGAGMAEGAGALAGKLFGTPAKGLEAVRSRIGSGQSGPLNLQHLDALVKWWQAADNPSAMAQRAIRVAANLRQMDPSGEAARIFRDMVASGMKMPITGRALPAVSPGFSRVARDVATDPMVRAGADAAMSADPLPPVAAGLGAGAVSERPLRTIGNWIMP